MVSHWTRIFKDLKAKTKRKPRGQERRPFYSATTPDTGTEKGWSIVNDITLSFILSVLASVVAYYICKWLDEDE